MRYLSFCSLSQFINEEIDALEATFPYNSIKTVIDKKRDVGYDQLSINELRLLTLNNVDYIKVPRKDNLNYYIFYNDKEKALKLFNISQLHDGMLKSDSFEEAVEIGTLLGYTTVSIDKYVFKKYGKHLIQRKIPIMPEIDWKNLSDD